MLLRPQIEGEADPAVAALLLAAAIEGDLRAGEPLPAEAFEWDGSGVPRARGMRFAEEKGPDVWVRPAHARELGRGDCAVLVRYYAQVWGAAVGVSPLREGKLHAVLWEDGAILDPARQLGMPANGAGPWTLEPIRRPRLPLEATASKVAEGLDFLVPAETLGRLALASVSPARLAAVARALRADPVARAAGQLLAGGPQGAAALLARRETRAPAAVALVFVLRVAPSFASELRARRPAADLGQAIDEVAEMMISPGCPGGCGL